MEYFTKGFGENRTIIPIVDKKHFMSSSLLNNNTPSPHSKSIKLRRIGSVMSQKSKMFTETHGKKAVSTTIALGKLALEKKKQHDIAKEELRDKLDEGIDKIMDDPTLSPKQKFRHLQRFGANNKKHLTQHQIVMLNQTLQNLDLQNGITDDDGNVKSDDKTNHAERLQQESKENKKNRTHDVPFVNKHVFSEKVGVDAQTGETLLEDGGRLPVETADEKEEEETFNESKFSGSDLEAEINATRINDK